MGRQGFHFPRLDVPHTFMRVTSSDGAEKPPMASLSHCISACTNFKATRYSAFGYREISILRQLFVSGMIAGLYAPLHNSSDDG